MNDTVAVALITSLSTLTAAGLAGWVSARTNDRQLRHQAALAREERAERRALDRRELRRETYERFLARADAAYRLLRKLAMDTGRPLGAVASDLLAFAGVLKGKAE